MRMTKRHLHPYCVCSGKMLYVQGMIYFFPGVKLLVVKWLRVRGCQTMNSLKNGFITTAHDIVKIGQIDSFQNNALYG